MTGITWWVKLIAVAAAGVALAGLYATWAESRRAEGRAEVQARWDADKLQRTAASAAEVAQARREEQESAARAAQGERDARDRAEAQSARDAAAARRAASAAGGLHGDIARLNADARAAGAPSAAACPGQLAAERADAVTARELLGACVTAHRELAADADAALGAVELRLDTALSWIRATGAPGSQP